MLQAFFSIFHLLRLMFTLLWILSSIHGMICPEAVVIFSYLLHDSHFKVIHFKALAIPIEWTFLDQLSMDMRLFMTFCHGCWIFHYLPSYNYESIGLDMYGNWGIAIQIHLTSLYRSNGLIHEALCSIYSLLREWLYFLVTILCSLESTFQHDSFHHLALPLPHASSYIQTSWIMCMFALGVFMLEPTLHGNIGIYYHALTSSSTFTRHLLWRKRNQHHQVWRLTHLLLRMLRGWYLAMKLFI